jgi:hypothetical protein
MAGDTAQISVTGVLVAQPSFMLWLFGVEQTAYGDITEALSRVASDASVKRVSLFVDGPGGAGLRLRGRQSNLGGLDRGEQATASRVSRQRARVYEPRHRRGHVYRLEPWRRHLE